MVELNINTFSKKFDNNFNHNLLEWFCSDEYQDIDTNFHSLIIDYIKNILLTNDVKINCNNSLNFSKCITLTLESMDSSDINNISFNNVIFDSHLIKMQFNNCIFNNCQFLYTSIDGCTFNSCKFFQNTFLGLKMVRSIINTSFFSSCSIRCSELKDSTLCNTELRDISFVTNNILNDIINNCNIRYTSFIKNIIDYNQSDNVSFDCNTYGLARKCPQEGSFIAYKKVHVIDNKHYGIAKLFIPEDAMRNDTNSLKCKCNKAKVLEITDIITNQKYETGMSMFNNDFVYKTGEMVIDNDYNIDSYHGIYFFIDKQTAINFQ